MYEQDNWILISRFQMLIKRKIDVGFVADIKRMIYLINFPHTGGKNAHKNRRGYLCYFLNYPIFHLTSSCLSLCDSLRRSTSVSASNLMSKMCCLLNKFY